MVDIPLCWTVDFETDRIEPRPDYPPEPVGVAIRSPNGKSTYYSWGHPSGNNTTFKRAKKRLTKIWKSKRPKLFFNAKFDLAVAYEKMGMDQLEWDEVHDAQFLAFLADPHCRELGLKPLAEDLLGWEPEEQDAIKDYVWDNRKKLVEKYGGKITNAKFGPNSPGAWISKCPADIVEPYAIGDVDRTEALFTHLYDLIYENYMEDAYDRERLVLPIFMQNEVEGIRIDVKKLRKDIPGLQRSLGKADKLLGDMLGYPGINIDADDQLAEAFTNAGVILDEDWILTAKAKKKSVSKDNLPYEVFQDEQIAHLYFYRNKLQTSLSTFLVSWLEQATVNGGYISTNWNQVRGGDGGTRTGRPSTSGNNFLNIPKKFDEEFNMQEGNEYGLEPLPYARDYILPDPGEVFLHRDFDGQEMRLFAHFSCGPLLRAYQSDPDTDPHEMVGKETARLQKRKYDKKKDRGDNKILNFQALYGGGIPAAAKKLKCTVAQAKEYKRFHDRALPERTWLNEAIAELLAEGHPMRTWGGRCYFVEQRRVIEGKMRDFLYKMINYLCQGSAADVTKEALIRWWYHPKRTARFLVTVYDEINISAPKDEAVEQMELLRVCMESIEMDVKMKTSGKMGPRWGKLEECA